MPPQWEHLQGGAGQLAVHVSPGSSPPSVATNTAVLCHGFPVEPDAASRTGRSFPALADRLSTESGWRVVTGCFRGVGPSEGDFSLAGWLDDIGTLVEHAVKVASGGGVWLVGFGTGGALSICHTGRLAHDDAQGPSAAEIVRGVACLGASTTFSDWGHDLESMLGFARQVGVVRSPDFPPDIGAWGKAFFELDPLKSASLMAPRPLLIVHGTDDDGVPTSDARALAEAGGKAAELHLLQGAGHRLRADPRAIALLIGWLERQRPI